MFKKIVLCASAIVFASNSLYAMHSDNNNKKNTFNCLPVMGAGLACGGCLGLAIASAFLPMVESPEQAYGIHVNQAIAGALIVLGLSVTAITTQERRKPIAKEEKTTDCCIVEIN